MELMMYNTLWTPFVDKYLIPCNINIPKNSETISIIIPHKPICSIFFGLI